MVPKGLKAGQAFIVRFPPTPSEPVTLQSSPVTEKEVGAIESTSDKSLAVEPPKDEPLSPTAISEPKSFMDILEDLITPDPDPDVLLFMKQEQEKREQESRAQEAGTTSTNPTAVGVAVKEPLRSSPAKAKKTKTGRIKALSSPRKVETREDSAGEDSDFKEAEESDDSGLEQMPSLKEKRPDRLSLVRSLEDFLTPVPDSRQDEPDSPKTLPAPTPAARGSRYSPRGAAGGRRPFSPKDVRDRQMAHRQAPAPYNSRGYMPSVGQKLLQVQVPPGLPPGSTIFVEIPGENRTVAAQVPPNVSSFHVAYMPQTYGTRVPPPTQARAVVVPKPQAGREKLLSVRVPPGTPPGTTLHVSVPDEPGRILAAQVPPGNVSKFHVSYIPSEHVMPHRSMLPPANAYQQPPSPSHPYCSRDPPIMSHSSSGWGADSYGGAGGASDVRDYPTTHRESWEGYDF